jgi:hypothetical protein
MRQELPRVAARRACQAAQFGHDGSRRRATYLKVVCRTNQNKREVGPGSVMRALPGPVPLSGQRDRRPSPTIFDGARHA